MFRNKCSVFFVRVWVCVGVVSLFEGLGLAIPHFPVGSKTIYGQRKGWAEKLVTCANSEGFTSIGLKKKKSLKLVKIERRD